MKKAKKQFVIRGPFDIFDSTYMYWNEDDGWGSRKTATRFSLRQIKGRVLPLESRYVIEIDSKGTHLNYIEVKTIIKADL